MPDKDKETPKETVPEKKREAPLYTKEQILQAAKFKDSRDLVAALLKDGGSYAVADVERLIKDYQKRTVK